MAIPADFQNVEVIRDMPGSQEDPDYLALFERGVALDGLDERHRCDRFWSMIQFYRAAQQLPGETVEAGCLFGLSSFLMCHYAKIHDPAFDGTGHHIVDSFRGFLPEPPNPADLTDDSAKKLKRLARKPYRKHRSFRHATERTLAEFPGVAYHEGFIPKVFETLEERRYRFVHIDVDLHDVTYACLDYFFPRVVEGGMLVVDDYGFRSWPGCRVAVDEWSARHGVAVIPLLSGNAVLMQGSRTEPA
jgi:hypothetical protein